MKFEQRVFDFQGRSPLAASNRPTAVGLIYGTVIVADSPSYSASLMELVPPRSLGGAFSLQMLFGWTVTAISPALFGATLDLTKQIQGGNEMIRWGIAYGVLAVAPLLGIAALRPLARREHSTSRPESSRPIANRVS